MCGIVGYVGHRQALPILVEGLRRLEYRGYDSAGLAISRGDGLAVYKRSGKVRELESILPPDTQGNLGIAHTRWATHGEPNDLNAHPHCDPSGRYAIVHNGIVENATQLRNSLAATGSRFVSDTDTEVLAHLIGRAKSNSLIDAVRQALQQVRGAYGLAVVDAERPDIIVAARNGGPVVLGVGDKEMFVASDAAALLGHAKTVAHLDDGEIAEISAEGFQVFTLDGAATNKSLQEIEAEGAVFDKGDYSHFMRKEIAEQPEAVRRVLLGRLDKQSSAARLGGLALDARQLLDVRRVKILGCGSAYFSGILGAHLIEELARIPASAEPASEFRYRNPVIERDTLYVAVSQSGETFDTLAAVQEIKRRGGQVLGVVNTVGSTIARECGSGVYLHAGPEISVVATKTFTCTITVFTLLALQLGRIRDLSAGYGDRIIAALQQIPDQITEILKRESEIEELADKLSKYEHIYFVGRGMAYSAALEGALKLKEVSYIHAEAYPASELKHGPLALIGPDSPSIVLTPKDGLHAKTLSTIAEIQARRGPVFLIGEFDSAPGPIAGTFRVPGSEPILAPLLLGIPLQLLAYHIALRRGCDIDQPRNLAKSVTVE
jgi:glucosamine--fructose-6-phosphate aminotransferase (isomerizing)